MRVFIVGQRSFGAAVLGLCLRRGHDVAGVCAPDGDRLAEAAADAGVDRSAELDVPAGVDLIIAAHCHRYIGPGTLAAARLGVIGYHPSLLPRHRGRDAVEWTIRMGDKIAGGTVYWLSEGADTGDIAAQEHCFVEPADDASTLWRRELFPLGLILIDRVLADLEGGKVVRVPQREAAATWEPSIGRPPLKAGDGARSSRAARSSG